MEVYRSPRTGTSWQLTDLKKAQQCAADWANGDKIVFDGTIDKTGERHTDVGVRIDDSDIVSLFNALVKRDKREKIRLSKELAASQADVAALRSSFRKIFTLLTFHRDQAPSDTDLIAAIQSICLRHALETESQGIPIDWIDWKSL